MVKLVSVSAAALLVAVLSFAAGGAFGARPMTVEAVAPGAAYSCPMHPQYQSEHPGNCPSCGMRLNRIIARISGGPAPAEDDLPHVPGAIHVSPERQQAVGVRLGMAEAVSGTRMLRTTGRVVPDENATYAIVAGVSGWIRTVGNATTGTLVKQNERLASFYSPEFAPVLQSYYASLGTFDQAKDQQLVDFNRARITEGVQRFADTLRNMGMSDGQLEQLRRKRELVQDVHLISPVDGFVLQRNVSAGLRFDRGLELYRIADLRHVWVLADVYQQQLPFIRRGATARVTTPQQALPISAGVSAAEPIFDQATLTLKVRLETPNPEFVLKPGMFVDVEVPIQLPPSLAVPADAIVDSGIRKTVFVEHGNGYFEPRQVETGWRLADEVEITHGLMAGERIVISGTFLIDSESRMHAARHVDTPDHNTQSSETKDPICSMTVAKDEAIKAGRVSTRGAETSYFCSDGCKKTFDSRP